jgi:glycosyltransferase involved in cell wall biosynthesis
MRILWLSHGEEIGGAEASLAESVTALAERGHELHVVLPQEGPLSERLASAAGVYICWHNYWASTRHIPLRDRLRWIAYDSWTASREIARIARQTDAEVIVTNTLVIATGALAARRAKRPHVWFLHEFGKEDHGYQFHFGRPGSIKFMNQYTDLFLVNSMALQKHFAQWIPATKLRRVHYGVEVPHDLPSRVPSDQTPRLVLVGHRKPSKGPQDAIAAIKLLAEAGNEVDLDLIGRGDPAFDKQLRDQVAQSGIDGRVHFVGFDEHHFELVNGADIALMCSRCEAFGRVTVEAMKLGKPVVGAESGATPELIRHGWNGVLYQPGHYVDLAHAIERLASDPVAAREMGKRGRSWALETFNRTVHAAELEEAFEPLVRAHRN